MARKTVCQKAGNGVKIGYSYLATSDHGPNSVMGSVQINPAELQARPSA
ncbi:hypothetical protein [Bradyrhizobium sp. AUGA SZCCT0042]|nr:hypothetical protein [Bradyrhizobium sp. AUGA SZCCT0042]